MCVLKACVQALIDSEASDKPTAAGGGAGTAASSGTRATPILSSSRQLLETALICVYSFPGPYATVTGLSTLPEALREVYMSSLQLGEAQIVRESSFILREGQLEKKKKMLFGVF